MGKWAVYSRDLGKDVEAGAKPKYLEAGSLPVSMTVDLDDEILKGIGKAPLPQQKLQEAAVGVADDLKKECIEDVKWADKMFAKKLDKIQETLKPIAELKAGWAVALELMPEFAKDDLPTMNGIGKIADGIMEGVDKGMDLVVAIKKANDRINDIQRLKKLAEA